MWLIAPAMDKQYLQYRLMHHPSGTFVFAFCQKDPTCDVCTYNFANGVNFLRRKFRATRYLALKLSLFFTLTWTDNIKNLCKLSYLTGKLLTDQRHWQFCKHAIHCRYSHIEVVVSRKVCVQNELLHQMAARVK